MTVFPNPVNLPDRVFWERAKRNQQVVGSAKLGIGIRFIIILIELVGVAWTSSSALFTDAMASLADIISSVFLILCIKLAQRPPDEDHPFGHGRYEPLGGLLLGLLLAAIGFVLFIQQLFEFHQIEETQPWHHPYAWVFSIVAVILLEICYRLIIHTARKEHSPALIVDAVHYRIDGITSLLATAALVIAAYFPFWGLLIDKLGALLIALLMIGLGFYAARENFHQVMDRAPDDAFFSKVRLAAEKVKGVKGTEKIRIQSYGPDAHVDIDIEVEPLLTVDFAHKISQQVRAEIQKAWPAVRDVTVHIEPYYANDH